MFFQDLAIGDISRCLFPDILNLGKREKSVKVKTLLCIKSISWIRAKGLSKSPAIIILKEVLVNKCKANWLLFKPFDTI